MKELANVFADTNVSVRTLTDATGDVWFVATDVAAAVGYSDAKQAVQNLMPDRKELGEIEWGGKLTPQRFSVGNGAQ